MTSSTIVANFASGDWTDNTHLSVDIEEVRFFWADPRLNVENVKITECDWLRTIS